MQQLRASMLQMEFDREGFSRHFCLKYWNIEPICRCDICGGNVDFEELEESWQTSEPKIGNNMKPMDFCQIYLQLNILNLIMPTSWNMWENMDQF